MIPPAFPGVAPICPMSSSVGRLENKNSHGREADNPIRILRKRQHRRLRLLLAIIALDTARPSSRRPSIRVSSILPRVGREQQAKGGLTFRGVSIKAHTEKVAMVDKYVPFDGMIMSRRRFAADRSTVVFTACPLDALRSDTRGQFHGRVANMSN
jgi:hypothetical protein